VISELNKLGLFIASHWKF